MARPIVLIPQLFRLADAIKFSNDYSPPSSCHLDLLAACVVRLSMKECGHRGDRRAPSLPHSPERIVALRSKLPFSFPRRSLSSSPRSSPPSSSSPWLGARTVVGVLPNDTTLSMEREGAGAMGEQELEHARVHWERCQRVC